MMITPLQEFMATLVANRRYVSGVTDEELIQSSEIVVDNAKVSKSTFTKNRLKYRRCVSLDMNSKLQLKRDRFADINPVGRPMSRSRSFDDECSCATSTTESISSSSSCSSCSSCGSSSSSSSSSSAPFDRTLFKPTRRHSSLDDLDAALPSSSTRALPSSMLLTKSASCRWDSRESNLSGSKSMSSMRDQDTNVMLSPPQRKNANAVWQVRNEQHGRGGGRGPAPVMPMMMPRMPTRSLDTSPTPPASSKQPKKSTSAATTNTMKNNFPMAGTGTGTGTGAGTTNDKGQDLIATIKMLSFRAAMALTKEGGPCWVPPPIITTTVPVSVQGEQQQQQQQEGSIISTTGNNGTTSTTSSDTSSTFTHMTIPSTNTSSNDTNGMEGQQEEQQQQQQQDNMLSSSSNHSRTSSTSCDQTTKDDNKNNNERQPRTGRFVPKAA